MLRTLAAIDEECVPAEAVPGQPEQRRVLAGPAAHRHAAGTRASSLTTGPCSESYAGSGSLSGPSLPGIGALLVFQRCHRAPARNRTSHLKVSLPSGLMREATIETATVRGSAREPWSRADSVV